MSKLNKDVLYLLFEELLEDSTSLFSCLLVNRLWCETVIPILWKNPWKNIIYRNRSSLYYVITSSLSNDIKKFLKRKRILFSTSCQPLLFDYLSFCRCINASVINDIISIGSSLAHNQYLLQQEIYSLFISKFPEVKYLDISSIRHQIFYFPEAKARLESLCELRCDTSIASTYLHGFAQICHHIQRLIIINTDIIANDGIAKIIENQMDLKHFEWIDDFDDSYIKEVHYEKIFLALYKKTHNITHFIANFNESVNYGKYLSRILPELRNLKMLKLDPASYGLNKQLKQSVYHNLEVVQINYTTNSTIACLINNSGKHLKKISTLDCHPDDNFHGESLILIRAISEKCPLVESLSLTFTSSKMHFIELEKLLKTCQNLKVLTLNIKITNERYDFFSQEFNHRMLESGKELSEVLIRSAPANLKDLRLDGYYNFKLSLGSLKTLLENWSGRAFSIFVSDSHYEIEQYRKVINKYKNDGVIKDFKRVLRRDIYEM